MTLMHNKSALGVALRLGTVLVESFGEDEMYDDANYLLDFEKNVGSKRFEVWYAGLVVWMVSILAVAELDFGAATRITMILGLAVLIGVVTNLLANYLTKRARKNHAAKLAERPEYWRDLSRQLETVLKHEGLGHFYTNKLG